LTRTGTNKQCPEWAKEGKWKEADVPQKKCKKSCDLCDGGGGADGGGGGGGGSYVTKRLVN
ncbi:hypothetical protein OS493_040595, partial [Desmophyllum pertusum]